MERIGTPTLSPLSPWFFAGSSFSAVDSNSNFHNYDSDPYRNFTMINAASQTLCYAQRLNGTQAMYSSTRGQ
jgi:hypothetical protein